MFETLPQLTGSEKQIAWAEKIRAEKLQEMTWTINALRWRLKSQNSERNANLLTLILACAEEIAAQPEAKFWIDNRGLTGRNLLQNIVNPRIAAFEAEIAARELESVHPVPEETPDLQAAPHMIPTNGSNPLPIIGEFTYDLEFLPGKTGKQVLLYDNGVICQETGEAMTQEDWQECVRRHNAALTTPYPQLFAGWMQIA